MPNSNEVLKQFELFTDETYAVIINITDRSSIAKIYVNFSIVAGAANYFITYTSVNFMIINTCPLKRSPKSMCILYMTDLDIACYELKYYYICSETECTLHKLYIPFPYQHWTAHVASSKIFHILQHLAVLSKITPNITYPVLSFLISQTKLVILFLFHRVEKRSTCTKIGFEGLKCANQSEECNISLLSQKVLYLGTNTMHQPNKNI